MRQLGAPDRFDPLWPDPLAGTSDREKVAAQATRQDVRRGDRGVQPSRLAEVGEVATMQEAPNRHRHGGCRVKGCNPLRRTGRLAHLTSCSRLVETDYHK